MILHKKTLADLATPFSNQSRGQKGHTKKTNCQMFDFFLISVFRVFWHSILQMTLNAIGIILINSQCHNYS